MMILKTNYRNSGYVVEFHTDTEMYHIYNQNGVLVDKFSDSAEVSRFLDHILGDLVKLDSPVPVIVSYNADNKSIIFGEITASYVSKDTDFVLVSVDSLVSKHHLHNLIEDTEENRHKVMDMIYLDRRIKAFRESLSDIEKSFSRPVVQAVSIRS